MRDAAYLIGPQGQILYVNDTACQFLGYSRAELLTMTVLDIDATFSADQWSMHWRDLEKHGAVLLETSHRCSDGRIVPIEVAANYFTYLGSSFNLALTRDISERRRTAQRVERLIALRQALSEISQAIVRMEEQAELFPLVCRCAVEFGGMSLAWVGQLDMPSGEVRPVAMYGSNLDYLAGIRITIFPDDPNGQGPTGVAMRESRRVLVNDYEKDLSAQQWQKRRLGTGFRSGGAFPILRGGAPFAVLAVYHSQVGAFDDESVSLLDELCMNISFALDNFDRELKRKAAEEKIWRNANLDVLTNLPNMALMKLRIGDALEQARHKKNGRFAILLVDLDNFKFINDSFGHGFGDTLIKAAAARLISTLDARAYVARLGGDEFVLLMELSGKRAEAYILAQQLVETFRKPLSIGGRDVVVTASIGVSLYPESGTVAERLISNADIAMYRAKALGRNGYQFFTTEMSEASRLRTQIEGELRLAVGRDQLHLVYQPKIDMASGCIIGCEALLRWQHPELGAISPAQFIPIAEDTGLIVGIGDWVLRTACKQNKAWQEAGLPRIVMSVNVSTRQFRQNDVPQCVRDVLVEVDLDAETLELELTESIIAEDAENVIESIDTLKRMGLKLSIDDFGTGFSSLSYLKRFRVDTLKIDQSFVRNMLNDQDDATIARAIIGLAHSLRMTVVAEGVESAQQCEFLRKSACDAFQGYLFSRPVLPESLAQMLRSDKRLSFDPE